MRINNDDGGNGSRNSIEQIESTKFSIAYALMQNTTKQKWRTSFVIALRGRNRKREIEKKQTQIQRVHHWNRVHFSHKCSQLCQTLEEKKKKKKKTNKKLWEKEHWPSVQWQWLHANIISQIGLEHIIFAQLIFQMFVISSFNSNSSNSYSSFVSAFFPFSFFLLIVCMLEQRCLMYGSSVRLK